MVHTFFLALLYTSIGEVSREMKKAWEMREEEHLCSVYFEQVGVMDEERSFAEYPVITLEQNEFKTFIL